MATIDWEKLADQFGNKNQFGNYATPGIYKTKIDHATVETVGVNESIKVSLFLEDKDGTTFRPIEHWVSTKNMGWTEWHHKDVLVLLGMSTENAVKAMEACAAKEAKADLVKAFETVYTRAASRHPEVEVEVYTERGRDGRTYSRTDFTDRNVSMKPRQQPAEELDLSDTADDISLDDIPFED